MKYLPKNDICISESFIPSNERFVSIDERPFVSYHHDFPANYIATINKAKRTKFTWKGLSCIKDPMTLASYQQIFQEVKPKTILEIGTYQGGSALWMNDMLNALEIQSKIYTFDKENDNINIDCNNIIPMTLDVYNIKNYVKDNLNFFKSLLHPIIVIDDCHTNLAELFSELDQFLFSGDYIIVEDTHRKDWYNQMLDFLKNKNYLIDTYYCDFWGLNNSCNINSYLIKQ
jgi:cephalosporin hydroxylase